MMMNEEVHIKEDSLKFEPFSIVFPTIKEEDEDEFLLHSDCGSQHERGCPSALSFTGANSTLACKKEVKEEVNSVEHPISSTDEGGTEQRSWASNRRPALKRKRCVEDGSFKRVAEERTKLLILQREILEREAEERSKDREVRLKREELRLMLEIQERYFRKKHEVKEHELRVQLLELKIALKKKLLENT